MWVITGRRPRSAAPTSTPVIAFSATGVSRTRLGPYFSTRPFVDPKMAAASGAPIPMMKPGGSLAMERSRASLSASTNLRVRLSATAALLSVRGVDMGRELVPLGKRARLGESDRVVDLPRDGLSGGLALPGGHDSRGLEPLRIRVKRVPGDPGVELAVRAVAEMAVVQGTAMLEPAIGLELQECRPLPGSGVSDGSAREMVDGLDVVAVPLEAQHAMALREVED